MTIPFPNAPLIHLIMETLAFFIGVRFYYYQRKQNTDFISDINRLWIMLGAILGALIGSRLVALFENPELIAQQTWLTFYQSKTVAGGFFGGLLGVELCKKIISVKVNSGDIYVIPIIIALIIGRIGCFGMGILEPTYGIETSFFTGMNLGDGKSRHPIILYEMITLFIMLLFFISYKLDSFQNGDKFKLFMLFYFGFRFLTEFLKPYNPLFIHLSVIHWLSITVYIYYFKFLIRTVNAKS